MKQLRFRGLMLALLLTLVTTISSQAELRLGVKGGVTVNELRFNRDVMNADNRAGFTGGLVADLSLPVTGLGVEASLLYTHRDNELSDGYETFKRDYIDIPVHVRLKFGILGLGKVISPYVFTGPSFSILFHDDMPSNYDNSRTYTSWDIGGGVELLNHLRVSASYAIGFTKAMRSVNLDYEKPSVQGKDRYWTLTAAYLF